MRPVSDEFLALVGGSHRVAVEAWCFPADGSDPVPVPLSEGTVSLEGSSAVRGRCDIQVEHAEWIPKGSGDRLAPFGPELWLRRGVVLSSGATELVSLGRFGIEDAEIADDGSGATVRVAALDRAERVSKAKFTDTFQVPNGQLYTEAIRDIVLGAYPDCPLADGFLEASAMTSTLLPTAQEGDDRWEAAQELAYAIGMGLYFDGDGVLTLRRFAASSPVVELVEGENGVLLSAARSWSRTAAFNKVVVTGESANGGSVYRAEAADLDSQSPTYVDGPFGEVVTFRSWPQIESQQQAQDVADAILSRELGVPSTVQFGMVPNPALEPDDTVLIRRPSVGVNESHVIDSLTIGLGASEVMTGSTRERRSV